jgi:hypothetical protein
VSSKNFPPIPLNHLIPKEIEFFPKVREYPLEFAILKIEPNA